jgi:DNA modification methylase
LTGLEAVLSGERAWHVECGDVLDVLKTMEAGSVHMVCTSPPYYSLRDYGTGTWEGGDSGCGHKVRLNHSVGSSALGGSTEAQGHSQEGYRDVCRRCGARRVDRQIGLEGSPDEYVACLVRVFGEIRRVLRDDGTCWLNIGDSYAQNEIRHRNGQGSPNYHGSPDNDWPRATAQTGRKVAHGFAPGNLFLIPHRVALALQADGWTVRMDAVWAKPAPMPESVSGWRWERHRRKVRGNLHLKGTDFYAGKAHKRLQQGLVEHSGNSVLPTAEWEPCPGCSKCEPHGGLVLRRGAWRPTRAHEYVFQLTKGERYYGDGEGVRTPLAREWDPETNGAVGHNDGHGLWGPSGKGTPAPNPAGANLRSVWRIGPEPLKDAHFACFPSRLPALCIQASTSERGVCPACGSPWARVVEREQLKRPRPNEYTKRQPDAEGIGNHCANDVAGVRNETVGWRPTCSCGCEDTMPAIVLDPFCGSGTTLLAARRLGRRALGIDLSPEYCAMARKRVAEDLPLFNG